jgi:hypothetical protein
MCQESIFWKAVVEAASSQMALKADAGEIHGIRAVPPRVDRPGNRELIEAAGMTVSFLRQRYALLISDDFLEERFNPESLADFLIELSMEMIAVISWFNQPTDKTALGTTRVSMLLFNAVLNLFIGNLVGRPNVQAEFAGNMKFLEETAQSIVLLRDSDFSAERSS